MSGGGKYSHIKRTKDKKFATYIKKQGQIGKELAEKNKDNQLGVGPLVIGFFLFVVVGSALFQLIRAFGGQPS